MAWVWWLAVPVVLTLLAALWGWWRGRPEPLPGTARAMRNHQNYLDALTQPPRQRDRRE